MTVLTREIVSGTIEPGDKLPREVDLAERFGVSRGVARETIRAMEERGLISVRHGKGATVMGEASWNVLDPDVLAVILEGGRRSQILEEYLECRRILEVEVAGIAAERAGPEEVTALGRALEGMEQSALEAPDEVAETKFHEADIAFHQALVAATGNRVLGGLVERIHAALLVARYPLARPEYRLERALPEHRRILEAVAAGDVSEARAAMNDHLETVLGYLRGREGSPSVERQ